MIAFLLVIAANSVTCTDGEDPDTVARRNVLISVMERQISQHQTCKTENDCTYLADVGGWILNKEGLVYVQTCSKRLKRVLFPTCFPEDPVMLSSKREFGMEPDQGSYPKNIECKQSKCVAIQNSKSRDWAKENAQFRSNHARRSKIDQHCENELRKLEFSKTNGVPAKKGSGKQSE